MKVVLDANIFVIALILKGGTQDTIVHHSQPYVIVVSEEILQEIERVTAIVWAEQEVVQSFTSSRLCRSDGNAINMCCSPR